MKLHHVLLLSALIGMPNTAAFADPPSNMQVFTSSGSFTVPSGVTKLEVEVRGGGGGAGGSTTFPGQGGCGGGYGQGVFTVTAGSTHTVTVGAGGGGSATGTGIAGGTSSFGTLISATGGGGGTANGSAGCAGGTSTATLNRIGEIGEQNGGGSQITVFYAINRGGLCGDGSTRGSGGRGINSAAGSAGAAGNVVVRW